MQFLISILLLSSLCLCGQDIYLQIEEINSEKVIKYYPGQTIVFTTNEYPDAWRKEVIKEIRPEDNLLILSVGFIEPSEIHSIKRTNRGALIMGHMMEKFAAAWLIYGGVAAVADGYKISNVEIIIGALAAGIGWIARKLFGKKNYRMKNIYRLRIIDVRFPVPGRV